MGTSAALLDSNCPLGDWDIVMDKLYSYSLSSINWLRTCFPFRLIPILPEIIPFEYDNQMILIYAALSFIDAHKIIQKEIPQYFPKSDKMEGALEEVARESNA